MSVGAISYAIRPELKKLIKMAELIPEDKKETLKIISSADEKKLIKIVELIHENKKEMLKITSGINKKYLKLNAEKAAQDIEIKRLRDLCKPLLRAKSADSERIITAKEFLEGIDFRPKTARSVRRSPRLSPKKHQTVVEKTNSPRPKNPSKRRRMETVLEAPSKKRMRNVPQPTKNATLPRWK